MNNSEEPHFQFKLTEVLKLLVDAHNAGYISDTEKPKIKGKILV